MEMNPCDMNQLDRDSHLPPRKRLFAGFNKLNSNGTSSPSSSSADVQTHLENLLASRFNNDHNQSPEELVEAARSIAKAAVKSAKAARAFANEKAFLSTKAIAAAKRALELVDCFPKQAMVDCKGKNKLQKHVPVELLYSNRQLRDEEDELACRLHRPIDKRQKKDKTIAEGESRSSIVMSDIVGVVGSDSSYEGLESNRKVSLKQDEADPINLMGKQRGVVKLKKVPLSIFNTRDQENRISSASALPVAQQPEDLKAPECEKQNKAELSII